MAAVCPYCQRQVVGECQRYHCRFRREFQQRQRRAPETARPSQPSSNKRPACDAAEDRMPGTETIIGTEKTQQAITVCKLL